MALISTSVYVAMIAEFISLSKVGLDLGRWGTLQELQEHKKRVYFKPGSRNTEMDGAFLIVTFLLPEAAGLTKRS